MFSCFVQVERILDKVAFLVHDTFYSICLVNNMRLNVSVPFNIGKICFRFYSLFPLPWIITYSGKLFSEIAYVPSQRSVVVQE